MRHLILSIILFVSFFSTSFADSRGYLDKLLNISYGPEIYEINSIEINTYNFGDDYIKEVYTKYIELDKKTKEAIIKSVKNNTYSESQISAIIRNYKSFSYYLNDFFFNLNIIDKKHYLKDKMEVKDAIINSYKKTRTYYKYLNRYINK